MGREKATLLRDRLRNQQLAGTGFRRPADVVAWLGAVQAQDYGGAKWAVALRAAGLVEADVDRAFDAGAILRTHILRPTWHFLAARDIRWMLAVSAPRVHAANAPYYRKLELTAGVLARSRVVLEKALRGRALTRAELAGQLGRAGIHADGHRLAYLMMHAELEAVVCSGPRRGKQFTYALLDERVPATPARGREEALAELTRRYFASHGPATVRDCAWWSGLTQQEVKAGLVLAGSSVIAQAAVGREWWSSTRQARRAARSQPTGTAWLLPNYDEYLIAYKDRDLAVSHGGRHMVERDAFPYHLIVDGALAGSWRRTTKTASVLIEVNPYRQLSKREGAAVAAAADAYGRFADLPVSLAVQSPRPGAL